MRYFCLRILDKKPMRPKFIITLAALGCCLHLSARQDTTRNDSGDGYEKFRAGSYGEMLYQRMDYGADRFNYKDGAQPQKRGQISIPRMILAFDYKFDPTWILSAEIEFEYGGTGMARELEYDEGGEYETELEKGGEVALEQFHLTKRFGRAFQLRFGHMIVPVGLTNAHHEPVNFFGTTRPEGDMTIIPCTWHETGLALLGDFMGFHYEAMVVAGLDPNGFSSRYWIQKGKQGLFEGDNMNSPALAGRIEYNGVEDLRIGVSAYWGNTASNTSKANKMKGLKGEVTIFSGDVQYRSTDFIFRANVLWGNLSDSYDISRINYSMPKAAGYPRTPVAQNALNYYAEAGYNVLSLFGLPGKLLPFVRYEYYNPMEKTERGVQAEPRNECRLLTAGINYFPLPNLVLKADYSVRRVGGGDFNNENTFGVSAGYVVWFSHK